MNNVRRYREKAQLSQKQLAERAKCSQPTISAIEQGGGTNLGLAIRLAEALNKPIGRIFPKQKQGQL